MNFLQFKKEYRQDLPVHNPKKDVFPFATSKDRQDILGWEIELNCQFNSSGEKFESARLKGKPISNSRQALLVKNNDEKGNEILYQFESELGSFIIESQSIEIEVIAE